MKRIIAMLMALMLCLGIMSGCTHDEDSQVVATVGDETITAGELKYAIAVVKKQSVGQLQGDQVDEFWNTEKDGKDAETYIREKAMDLLLDIAVCAQAAKDNGITISSTEVDDYYQDNKESMEEALNSYPVTQETIKAILRKQMLYGKYGERVLSADPRFNPTDEELQAVFSENYIKAQHILKMNVDQETGDPLPKEEADRKLAEAQDLLAQIRAGADFAALMNEYSEDPGIQQQPDGYVFTEGEMVQEFYEAAKALPENGVSDIVETSYGYHIIKRLPLDMEVDFPANLSKVKTFQMQAEEDKLIEELKASMDIHQEDAKINAIPVKD